MQPQSTISRFWSKVDMSGECWLWRAGTNGVGYGYFGLTHARPVLAHRLAYELTYGPIPPGLSVLHHCDTRACVRPEHLFLGTRGDNHADMMAKSRQARGMRHGGAKLSQADVREIRQRHAQGESMAALGRLFGVNVTTVWSVVHRHTWRHI